MEMQLLIYRVLFPAFFAVLGSLLLMRTKESLEGEPVTYIPRDVWCTFFGGLIIAFALAMPELSDQGLLQAPSKALRWEPSYQWQWLWWILPLSIVGLALSRILLITSKARAAVLWPSLVVIALGCLYVAFLESDLWGGRWFLIINSLLLGILAFLINMSTLDEMASSGAGRWLPWVVLGQLGCVAALSLQYYGSLGAWVVTGIGVTLGIACVSGFQKQRPHWFGSWPHSIAIYPLMLQGVIALLLCGFFQSKPTPPWLVGLVLFLPSLVWFFDIVYGRYGFYRGRGRLAWRVFLAAAVCMGVLALLLWWTNPFQTEW